MKYIAEFFGTFILALVVLLSLAINPPFATPVLAAITLGLFVYAIGHISGAHINPVVTLGLFTLGKIAPMDALGYVVSQLLGGAAALLLASTMLIAVPAAPAKDTLLVFAAETLGMLVFAFGIASVVYGRVSVGANGAVVGGFLLIGIVLAVGVGSAGILNPAVALALGSLNVSYLGGEIVGSILGFQLYRLLSETKKPATSKKK